MSYWSIHEARAAGVAILLNPYKIQASEPALTELWSPHLIAITCEVEGQSVLMINVYAPSEPVAREDLFAQLADHDLRHQGPIIVGGDFNCTLHPDLDRSNQTTAHAHQSPQLKRWTMAWGIADALAPFFPDQDATPEDIAEFQAAHHTYRYQVSDSMHSSRLDRWYLSDGATAWTQDVLTTDMGGGSDHAAVTLALADPAQAPMRKSQPKIYPPKACAVDDVRRLTESAIDLLQEEFHKLDQDGDGVEPYIATWEYFKARLAREIKQATKAATRRVNGSFKTKLARIRRRIRDPARTHAEISALERQLTATVTQWQALKKRKQWSKSTASGGQATKAFFARATAQRVQRPVITILPTEGAPPRAPTDLPNLMADGWESVFRQPERVNEPTRYSAPTVRKMSTHDAALLASTFTMEEVQKSIKRCKRSKSGGPDKLPNAWYRDFADEIAPVLHTLYAKCYETGTVPPSFQDATIVCIPKAGRTSNPLGYRPISLLNTDYKIYMRLLTTRLKPMLPEQVSPSQGGFVPGRDIHDVIDLFTGAQRHATETNADTIAILLDFQKAYDSLDRQYLVRCLEHGGFPRPFLRAIQATHSDTTARFCVNGLLSRRVTMTRGIRQGCPLAPMLFILALDPLYRGVTADPELSDPVPDWPGSLPPVGGFADDTALYAAGEHKLPRIRDHLDAFAVASGLQINMNKSVAFRLNPEAQPMTDTAGFATIQIGELCRYLGIQVGRAISQSEVWNLTTEQIEKRLAMAAIKTHSTYQRAALAVAVILPKILYVARHHWPTVAWTKALDTRIRNFVWTGLFAERVPAGAGTQRWMARDTAVLGKGAGGIGIPDLKLELITLAAQVVTKWAYEPHGLRTDAATLHGATAGLAQADLYLTTTPAPPGLKDSLWKTGLAAVRWIYSSTMEYPLQLLIRDGAAALITGKDWRWWRGEYERDYTTFMNIGGNEILRMREEADGRLCPEWIQHVGISEKGSAILHKDGSTVTLKHLRPLGHGNCVADFVSWQWLGGRTLRFRPTARFPMTNEQAATFTAFCDMLVANFPGIIKRPVDPGHVRTYNIPATTDMEWFYRGGILHRVEYGYDVAVTPVRTQHDLQHLHAIRLDKTTVIPSFECTPALTRLVLPWRGSKPWKPARRHLKRALGRELRRTGLCGLRRKAAQWKESDAGIAAALEAVNWHEFVREQGLTTYETQLWTRLRHHQLQVWGRRDQERECARTECTDRSKPTPEHVVWECEHAKQLWTSVARLWGATASSPNEIKTAVFSRRPPPTEIDWHTMLSPSTGSLAGDRIAFWLQRVWLQLVTCGIQRLWARSVQATMDTDEADSRCADDLFAVRHKWTTQLRGNIRAAYAHGMATTALDVEILRAFYKGLAARDVPLQRYPTTGTRYLLFFDGGSRGNPGPGGSGSVMIRLGGTPQLVWAASMSYAQRTTTNNFAEYQGLCTGLGAAAQHGWHPLDVVGDSMMIIRQLTKRRPPKVPGLRDLYERARTIADGIRVRGWHHHYRSHNKMADKAANQAMDSGSSYQAHAVDNRKDHVEIQEWLLNDVHHWLSNNAQPSSD